jgi:hypothetical protein
MINTYRLSTEEKALRINLDRSVYGSFNEIGAGQEVAATFFRAGGSSGTIAASRSAYDMKVSDTIYGKCKRYVCEERLLTMLDMEYNSLVEMLPERKDETRFFAFANTVEALNFHKTNQGHGWIGLKFQLTPNSEPNECIIHVKMHDSRNFWQQEALGILGVNLIYACFYHHQDPELLLTSLGDRLSRERMEIDMFRLSGPDFSHVDNRLMALKLVRKGMTDATMFDPDGNVLQPSEALYKKNVLVLRGRFRPPTLVNFDMLEKGLAAFKAEEDVEEERVTTLFELTLKDLRAEGEIDEQDFLDRAQLLGMLGQTVMISNYAKYYKLVEYLSSFTKGYRLGVVLGVYSLETIFDTQYYDNLEGGILQAFGNGFGRNVKLFCYPAVKLNEDALYTLDKLDVRPELRGLLQYMIDNNKLGALEVSEPGHLAIYSDKVIQMIKEGEQGWETMVPKVVSDNIIQHKLFGYQSTKSENHNQPIALN